MISVEEGQRIVMSEVGCGPVRRLPLLKAFGLVLAEAVDSRIDAPLFDASAMDGFALHHEESAAASQVFPARFKNTGLVAAGDAPMKPLRPGETCKVMTGAMLPPGATAVIPQEEVLLDAAGTLLVFRRVEEGDHVRRRGEEIRKGETALPENTPLSAGAVGFLASLGVFSVPVYAPPRVSIVPTGSELVRSLSKLGPGKILESNSLSLCAALRDLGLLASVSAPVPDGGSTLRDILERRLSDSDFVVVTGGVSVGDFDRVKEVLAALGVETRFWKIAQKPGKPIWFGRRKNMFVFGLPGNPSSSLVCFYEYVRPALLKWMGHSRCFLEKACAKLMHPLSKKEERAHFLRARAALREGDLWVEALGGQESHKMASFAKANALLFVPAGAQELPHGSAVTIHWL